QRALAQDRDELLAERPLPLLVDVALETEQAPLGYLPRGDFVHDRPLSAQPADEVVGELAARVVHGLDLPPVRRYPLRGIGRIAREQLPDRRERQLELADHHDKAWLIELRRVVVAIARRLIDARRHQHPAFVVEAQCLQRKAGPPSELPDADLFHADSLVAGPIRPGKMSVRSPPR